jgi:hypothetical protein
MHAKPGLVDHLADLLSMREFVDPQRLARYVGEHLRTRYQRLGFMAVLFSRPVWRAVSRTRINSCSRAQSTIEGSSVQPAGAGVASFAVLPQRGKRKPVSCR